MTLTIASYNIQKGFGADLRRRPQRALDVLLEIDADIVVLQEADRRFGARAAAIPPILWEEHSPWSMVPLGARAMSCGWHGNAILVRREAEVLGCEAIHLPALEPRGAVRADVRLRGISLRVVGMHLDLSGLWRRRQARAILSHLEAQPDRMPAVVAGDTNEWGSGGALRDFARMLDFAATGASFHAARPVARLDRILASRTLEIVAAGVHASPAARRASDHLPVWARVRPR